MFSFFLKFDDFFYKANRERLRKRHNKNLSELLKKSNNYVSDNSFFEIPKIIKNILIIDKLGCFGDSLFVNGLARKILLVLQINVFLVTEPKFFQIFSQQVTQLFDINELYKLKCNQYDILIDLDYRDSGWLLKENFSIDYKGFTISCSKSIVQSKFYSGFINFSPYKHFSHRMGVIYALIQAFTTQSVKRLPSRMFHCDELFIQPIFPFIKKKLNHPKNKKEVYINAVGRFAYRCLSQDQLSLIIHTCLDHNYHIYLYIGDKKFDIPINSAIDIVKSTNFIDACDIMSMCDLIITPDTAAVHVSSAFNIPILAMFCENDLEYFGYPMEEVWTPLATKSIIIKPEQNGLRRQSLSLIKNSEISKHLNKILNT